MAVLICNATSCSPNAHAFWDISTFSARLRAMYPIPSGTQITIEYVPLASMRSHRQNELRSKYDFTCSCSSCSLPDKESELSDSRRSNIWHLVDKLYDEDILKNWLKDPDASVSEFIGKF